MNTKHIWTDPERLDGKPCLRNHRFSLSQLLAEIAEYNWCRDLAVQLNIPLETINGALNDLATAIDNRITIVDGYDWQGMYVGEELVTQGHQIYLRDLLTNIFIPHTIIEVDDEWLTEHGQLPNQLSEVKVQQ